LLSAQHSLDGAPLDVKKHTSSLPQLYEQKLLIKGVNPITSNDALENFLEAKSGAMPIELISGKDGTVLVSFETEPGLYFHVSQ